MGRPTRYRSEYSKLAFELCLLGYTDDMLAEVFRVAPSTVSKWKTTHAEFSEALRGGKVIADAHVANALYQRALGYEHEEEWIGQYKGEPVIVKTVKHYPPDVGAASLWLRNRQPERWRDKVELASQHDLVTTRRDSARVTALAALP